MSILYKNIEKLCNRKGITGYRLCKDVSMSPNVITELRMGRREGLSTKNIQKIADYFGVSVGYLLGEEEKENAPANGRDVFTGLTNSERDMLFAYRSAPQNIKDIIDTALAPYLERKQKEEAM